MASDFRDRSRENVGKSNRERFRDADRAVRSERDARGDTRATGGYLDPATGRMAGDVGSGRVGSAYGGDTARQFTPAPRPTFQFTSQRTSFGGDALSPMGTLGAGEQNERLATSGTRGTRGGGNLPAGGVDGAGLPDDDDSSTFVPPGSSPTGRGRRSAQSDNIGAGGQNDRLAAFGGAGGAGAPTANPYRAGIREGGYDPHLDGPPRTISEAHMAQNWIRGMRQQVGHIFFAETAVGPDGIALAPGYYKTGTTGEPIPATAEEVALLQELDALTAQTNDVLVRDAEFRSAQGIAQIEQQSAMMRAQLEAQLQQTLQSTQHSFEADMARQEHEQRLRELDFQLAEERLTRQLEAELAMQTLERQGQIDAQLMDLQQRFQAEQAALDRALASAELAEASRAAQAQEQLQREQHALEMDQFKVATFQMLSSEPMVLYFLGQSGNMDQFRDILGESGIQALDSMMENINRRPSANIQQFARMTSEEQAAESFAQTARTGVADITGALRGEAPLAGRNQVSPNAGVPTGAPGRLTHTIARGR